MNYNDYLALVKIKIAALIKGILIHCKHTFFTIEDP